MLMLNEQVALRRDALLSEHFTSICAILLEREQELHASLATWKGVTITNILSGRYLCEDEKRYLADKFLSIFGLVVVFKSNHRGYEIATDQKYPVCYDQQESPRVRYSSPHAKRRSIYI